MANVVIRVSPIAHPFTSQDDWLALRARNLNSTEIAVLFGRSPYMSLPELWDMKKAGAVQHVEENTRMFWGKALQDAIAAGACSLNGWSGGPLTDYYEIPEERVGASFDWLLVEPHAILEIKNVDYVAFKKDWVDDAQGLQAPVHIELQVQHQMMVKGVPASRICALVGGNTLYTIERGADPDVQGAMAYKASEFWKTIDAGTPPPVDFTRDADFILSKYRTVVPKKTVDVREVAGFRAYVQAYRDLQATIKDSQAQQKTCKARMVAAIGDAEVALGGDFKIHSSTTKGGDRSLRITFKDEEEQP